MPAKRRDLYAMLGVAREADADAIRKAYRKLARENHPDLHPGDKKAEDRFKEIAEAYDVLSDAGKRALYDEFGDVSLQAGFDVDAMRKAQRGFGGFGGFESAGAEGAEEMGFEDLLGSMFGARGARRARRLQELELDRDLEVVAGPAARGVSKPISVTRPDAEGLPTVDRVTVQIPAGLEDGARIRLAGKGGEGRGGAPSGDLYVRVRIRPHPWFRRDGRDLALDLPITVAEAALGARIEIPTLEGRATVKVPAGSDSGRKLRLRGKGLPDPKSGARGDLYVTVQIRVPVGLDDDAREALRKLEAFDPPGLRKEWDE